MSNTPITLRLDRWASDLRNRSATLDEDEMMELSTLLTEAANTISTLHALRKASDPVGLNAPEGGS